MLCLPSMREQKLTGYKKLQRHTPSSRELEKYKGIRLTPAAPHGVPPGETSGCPLQGSLMGSLTGSHRGSLRRPRAGLRCPAHSPAPRAGGAGPPSHEGEGKGRAFPPRALLTWSPGGGGRQRRKKAPVDGRALALREGRGAGLRASASRHVGGGTTPSARGGGGGGRERSRDGRGRRRRRFVSAPGRRL
ncbi:translation initiation factor IF-2-like [Corvus kubaryi]|uniref:translation initiation factor IF-2-like n=1 Tax=Corvus kubaryi TaxID=68294 RepID=UPI001C041149|nr:translation initiation factor IF-2-like [Corvus kubaryi]